MHWKVPNWSKHVVVMLSQPSVPKLHSSMLLQTDPTLTYPESQSQLWINIDSSRRIRFFWIYFLKSNDIISTQTSKPEVSYVVIASRAGYTLAWHSLRAFVDVVTQWRVCWINPVSIKAWTVEAIKNRNANLTAWIWLTKVDCCAVSSIAWVFQQTA